jgi:hypothetical protein
LCDFHFLLLDGFTTPWYTGSMKTPKNAIFAGISLLFAVLLGGAAFFPL